MLRDLRSGVAAIAAGVCVAVGSAEASPQTLKRSISNILCAPFDIVLSPVVAARSIYLNLQETQDSLPVRIFYPLPGFAWNTGVQVGAGGIRLLSGVLELLPGLALLFFEKDLDPLFDPAERGEALLDADTPPLRFKIGVDYTRVVD